METKDTCLILTLPFPISQNQIYKRRAMGKGKSKGRGLMLTDEAKAYKFEAGLKAKMQMNKQGLSIFSSPVVLEMKWYPPDRRKRDGSNLVKVLFDALNNIVYTDDSLIEEEHYYKQTVVPNGIIRLRFWQRIKT
jgi:Holliday junction resolvase RusA-like endonuclease